MTLQTDAPLTHTSLHASNRQARDGDVLLDAEYQRGSVWSDAQRALLVKSWLLGVPVPAVMLNVRYSNPAWARGPGREFPATEPAFAAIVGRQRIETAVSWFFGDLAVPASWFPADHVEQTVDTDDGPYVRYAGLTPTAQRLMGNRAMLPAIEAQVDTVQAEASLYLLLNTAGTSQTDEDMDRARAVAGG
jgi:hypothetical protein